MRLTVLARRFLAAAALALSAPASGHAQRADSTGASLDSLVEPASMHVTRRDIAIAGGIAGAGFALLPFDAALSRRLRSPDLAAYIEASRDAFQAILSKAGYGTIATEIKRAGPFYYAENYHQQYLAKNPHGYRCHAKTGVAFPVSA